MSSSQDHGPCHPFTVSSICRLSQSPCHSVLISSYHPQVMRPGELHQKEFLFLLETTLARVASTLLSLFKASALWTDAFYKSKCPSVCTSVCPCVCLFTFEVPFNGLFAPTSQSRMSNIFRDSESLGISNGKKWSNM